MINNPLNFILIFFSIFLAFGKMDPIFSLDSPVKSVDIFFIVFCGLFFLLRFNDFLKAIFSKSFLCLISIFLLFIFAQILNGYSDLVKPLFNFKFLLCSIFFVLLVEFFKKNPYMIHYCLLAFSISSFFYSIIVLFISPDLYQIIKGQMIVLDENPNSTSSRLAIASVYFIYFFIQNPLNWKKTRFFLAACLPTLFAMIIMSGSRGSLLAALLGSYLVFIFSDIKKISKLILTSISIFCSFFLFQYLLSSDDLGTRWEKALEGDTAGRTDIWEAVFLIVFEKPIGVGETGYLEKIINLYGMYIDTHNIFLYILVCGGFLSLLIFLFFLSSIFYNCIKCYLIDKEILPLIFLLIMLFIAAKTGGVITFLLFWFVLAIVSSYRKVDV
ncbi:O-antigen ligase family protein [Acinetobacter sp. ANC 3781]